jgi:hypothetical protein
MAVGHSPHAGQRLAAQALEDQGSHPGDQSPHVHLASGYPFSDLLVLVNLPITVIWLFSIISLNLI